MTDLKIYKRTDQKTRIETNQLLDTIQANKIIAPYGLDHTPQPQPWKIITRPEHKPQHLPHTQKRTNNKIHTKLLIGQDKKTGEWKAITGSWNLRKNTTQHELALLITNPQTILELNQYFDEIWNRSKKEREKPRKITRLEEMM